MSDTAAVYNRALAQLKLTALEALAKALAATEDPAEIRRLATVILRAQPHKTSKQLKERNNPDTIEEDDESSPVPAVQSSTKAKDHHAQADLPDAPETVNTSASPHPTTQPPSPSPYEDPATPPERSAPPIEPAAVASG